MIRTNKGVLGVTTTMLTFALLLNACSGGSGATNGNASPSNAGEASASPAASETATPADNGAAALEPYTIKLVYTGAPQADEAKVEAKLNEYLKDKINASIDLMPIDWGPWDDKINLMIASRQKVDIIFTAQWNKHAVNVAKGAFIDLGDLLKENGQDILKTLDPVFLEGAKINGKNYGVPTNKELAAQGGIIYRKDIADELGIDMTAVKTIADLDNVYKVVKEKHPELTPLYLKDGETFNSHYFGNYDALGDTSIPGIILKDEDGTMVKANYDVARYVDTLKLTRDFFKKGYINSDAATNQTMNYDAMKAGNVFSMTSSLKPGKDKELENQTGMTGKLAQLELNTKTIATSETAGSMLGISSTSEDPARAMMFINLLHSDKFVNNLLNFGIENDHYAKVSDEVIKSTDNTKNYNPGAAWMFGSQFLNYVWETEDPNKWEKFKEFNQNAKVSPGLGFVFDGESLKAEIGAVVNVDKQYLTALETGSVDVDKVLPEYTAKLKSAGIEKIIAEKQSQFDKFLASK
ncbi:ABC transporter substrate-binding protein [Paenibacillus sp. FSL H8-0537]|uniref:ABC transporter substrate-binding protein n=1 Tax=Paenibacillus sp. FSL H8-0537 TaxID=2921399 RepID=UPI0031017131